MFRLGMAYLTGRQGLMASPGIAVEKLKRAVELGHVEAKYQLGMLYLQGRGAKQDVRQGIALLDQAGNQNHAGALLQLGQMCLRGLGVVADAKLARGYLQRAAAAGSAEARDLIARLEE